MKTLNHKLLKTANWILSGILAVLGFSGCNGEEMNEMADMYGCPHATFNLYGKVLNVSKSGIPDIKLELQFKVLNTEGGKNNFIPGADPIITDKDGNFRTSLTTIPTDVIRIIATDIDGDTNGSYAKDSIDIKISKEDYLNKGDSEWDYGFVSKDNLMIELKEKKKNE